MEKSLRSRKRLAVGSVAVCDESREKRARTGQSGDDFATGGFAKSIKRRNSGSSGPSGHNLCICGCGHKGCKRLCTSVPAFTYNSIKVLARNHDHREALTAKVDFAVESATTASVKGSGASVASGKLRIANEHFTEAALTQRDRASQVPMKRYFPRTSPGGASTFTETFGMASPLPAEKDPVAIRLLPMLGRRDSRAQLPPSAVKAVHSAERESRRVQAELQVLKEQHAAVLRDIEELKKRHHWEKTTTGALSPELRFASLRDCPPHVFQHLTGWASSDVFEAFVNLLDACNGLTDCVLFDFAAFKEAVEAAGPLTPEQAASGTVTSRRVTVHKAGAGGAPRKMSVMDWALMCFYKVKTGCTDALCAYLFNISETTFSSYFITFFCYLLFWLEKEMPMPGYEQLAAHTPVGHMERFGNSQAEVAMDSVQFGIEASTNPMVRKATFNQYKHGTTSKHHVTVSAIGTVLGCSDGFAGSVSDDEAALLSGHLDDLPSAIRVLLDRGYPGLIEKLIALGNNYGQPSFRDPSFNNGNLNADQARESANISNPRTVVERAIGRPLAQWGFLQRETRVGRLDMHSVVVKVLFMLSNYGCPLVDFAGAGLKKKA